MQYANQISQDLELPNSDGYKKKSLNSWKLAPVVPKNKGLPGEMGKVRLYLWYFVTKIVLTYCEKKCIS